MWPTSFGIAKFTKADEEKIGALVRRAESRLQKGCSLLEAHLYGIVR